MSLHFNLKLNRFFLFIFVVLGFALASCFVLIDQSFAETEKAEESDSSFYWSVNGTDDDLTLTLSPDFDIYAMNRVEIDGKSSEFDTFPAWFDYRYSIKKVSIALGKDDKKIKPKSVKNWFYQLEHLKSIDLTNLDTSECVNFDCFIAECKELEELDLSFLDTSKGESFFAMVACNDNLKNINLSNLNTSNAKNLEKFFYWDLSLVSLDLKYFSFINCTNAEGFCQGCASLKKVNLSSFIYPNKEMKVSEFFANCKSLEVIYASGMAELQKRKFDLNIFDNCLSLKGGNGSKYDENIDACKNGDYFRIDGADDKPGFFTFNADLYNEVLSIHGSVLVNHINVNRKLRQIEENQFRNNVLSKIQQNDNADCCNSFEDTFSISNIDMIVGQDIVVYKNCKDYEKVLYVVLQICGWHYEGSYLIVDFDVKYKANDLIAGNSLTLTVTSFDHHGNHLETFTSNIQTSIFSNEWNKVSRFDDALGYIYGESTHSQALLDSHSGYSNIVDSVQIKAEFDVVDNR